MTLDEIMDQLRVLSSEKMCELNASNGANENQFGVKMGDLRTSARLRSGVVSEVLKEVLCYNFPGDNSNS